MAFGDFLNRLFGRPAPINDDPFAGKTTPPVAPATTATPLPAGEIVVHRDEMIDARSRIAGYRFTTGSAEPARRVAALRGENLGTFAQRRLVLLPIAAADWTDPGYRQFAAANIHFLVPPPVDREQDQAAWLDTLQQIRDAGGCLAIDDAGTAIKAAAALADLFVLDIRGYALDGFERHVRRLRRLHPDSALAVDGIASWPEHRLAQSLGIHYSLGGFAATADEEERTDHLNQSRLTLIEMLNLLRADAELAEIATVARRDPGIAVKIVSMANSPVSGLSAPVASLDQAMLVLGRGTIYRWLSIAMFRAGSAGSRDETLLELALWRARFLELASDGRRSRQECDELFLVGLLSLIDNLLGLPMADIVGRMNLPPHVADVLLRSDGPYGSFLLLAMAMERGRDEQAARIAASLGLATAGIVTAARQARAWSEAALAAA